jgi:hypothetical protein
MPGIPGRVPRCLGDLRCRRRARCVYSWPETFAGGVPCGKKCKTWHLAPFWADVGKLYALKCPETRLDGVGGVWTGGKVGGWRWRALVSGAGGCGFWSGLGFWCFWGGLRCSLGTKSPEVGCLGAGAGVLWAICPWAGRLVLGRRLGTRRAGSKPRRWYLPTRHRYRVLVGR